MTTSTRFVPHTAMATQAQHSEDNWAAQTTSKYSDFGVFLCVCVFSDKKKLECYIPHKGEVVVWAEAIGLRSHQTTPL